MKMQIVLLMGLILVSSSVDCQSQTWTELMCGIDNGKLYDGTLGFNTCNDYCVNERCYYGRCELNKGYGECQCTCGADTT